MNELTYEQRADIGIEYVRSLLKTASPYGAQEVRHLKVYVPDEREDLEKDLYNVERAISTLDAFAGEYALLARAFSQLKDIRHSIKRCEHGVLSEVELFEVRQFLLQLTQIAPAYSSINAIANFRNIKITAMSEALQKLDIDGEESAGFYIDEKHSPELARIRLEKRELERRIRESSSAQRDVLLKERTLLTAREEEEETRVRALMSERLRPYMYELINNTNAIGRFDFTVARARLARAHKAVKPILCDDGVFIAGMENPCVKDALIKRNKEFTPVSIELMRGATVVTGANMGGKSVALKTLALTVLLVHAGIYPFAKSVKTQLFDNVFMLFEDAENAEKGLSSFGAEIVRINGILHACGDNSLILLDEPARGTNPYEGAQIVRALVKRLNALSCVSVLSTHYDHAAEHANAHYQVVGLRGRDLEGIKKEIDASAGGGVEVVARHMNYGLYRAKRDNPCPRDALNVCRLLGLDEGVMAEIEKLY
jgi:dsDNA-specific endonuclease/ATPase MutS2